MACATVRQLLHPTSANPNLQFWASPFTPCSRLCTTNYTSRFSRLAEYSCGHRNLTHVPRALPGNKGGGSTADEDDDDGVSLGTMKLPLDTDLPRFETLLFQVIHLLIDVSICKCVEIVHLCLPPSLVGRPGNKHFIS